MREKKGKYRLVSGCHLVCVDPESEAHTDPDLKRLQVCTNYLV